MKRAITLLLALGLGGVLAACGGAPTTTTQSTDVPAGATSMVETPATSGMTDTGTMTDTEMMDETPTEMMDETPTEMMDETPTEMMDETPTAGDVLTDTGAMTGDNVLTGTGVLTETTFDGTIVDAAAATPEFSLLVTALSTVGLTETLSQAGPFTVFAPTDEAFGKLPAGTIEALLLDTTQLSNLLSYHVVDGDMSAADISAQSSVTTLQTQPISVTTENGMIMLNGTARVIQSIKTDNGVIHVIDGVLLPPDFVPPAASREERAPF